MGLEMGFEELVQFEEGERKLFHFKEFQRLSKNTLQSTKRMACYTRC